MKKFTAIMIMLLLLIFTQTAFCEENISVEFDEYMYKVKVGKMIDVKEFVTIKGAENYTHQYKIYSSDETVIKITNEKLSTVSVGNATVTVVVYFSDDSDTFNKYAAGYFKVEKDGNIAKTPDINTDGVINADDLSALLSDYGRLGGKCDINHNGKVDISDLSVILHRYGNIL